MFIDMKMTVQEIKRKKRKSQNQFLIKSCVPIEGRVDLYVKMNAAPKGHDGVMENDIAATIQKYILYLLVGVGLFAALGLVVSLIKLIF